MLYVLPSLFAAGQKDAGKGTYKIATVVKITGIPWFSRLEVGVKQAGKDLGVNAYQIGPADADPAQQVKMVEDLIDKGVDAMCITPNDVKALEPAFTKAKEKGLSLSLTNHQIRKEKIML